MTLLIDNCRLHTPSAGEGHAWVCIEAGTIKAIGNGSAAPICDRVINAEGRLLIPGLIDVHIHGAGGGDMVDGTVESIPAIASMLARSGVTSFLGTTFYRHEGNNEHLTLAREAVNKALGGAILLGVHLEGPFINPVKKGGLNPTGIHPSSDVMLERVFAATGDSLRILTIAPEMPGNLDIIREVTRRGVVASFGHSNASYEQTHAGFDAGIRHVTHIFNAMLPLHHRLPGPLAAIVERKGITAEIIGDGYHLHPAIVHFIHTMLGDERCVCISDGMAATGLPEGSYIYNGREYESRGGAARYVDGTLIGSTMSLLKIAFQFQSFTGCSLEAAINSVTLNPARVLGLGNRKGIIKIGADADLVLIDADNEPFSTIVNGTEVYRRSV
jgi:N-acetylglucosamine-6-phosphate deacetylase